MKSFSLLVLLSLMSAPALADAPLSPADAQARAIPLPDNTHLIEATQNGFAIYRTSKPNRVSDFKRLCESGVTEIMVLDGTGERDAKLAERHCPQLKVIYDQEQAARRPMDETFIAFFDRWVEEARLAGKKIAFRCTCGCHRTGRLAAYYQMKYQGYTAEQAIEVMMRLGRFMFAYPELKFQVRALEDHILGRPCSQRVRFCVKG